MRDPLLIDEGEKRIPDEWRRRYLKRSIAELPADVVKVFDRVWAVEREKDKVAGELIETQRKLRQANLKIWVMSLIVSPLIGEGVKALLHWAFSF